jgi:hypothetical protein
MASRRVVAIAPREIGRSRTSRDVDYYYYRWEICLGSTSLGARTADTMSSGK